jgi:hypothetical protein
MIFLRKTIAPHGHVEFPIPKKYAADD